LADGAGAEPVVDPDVDPVDAVPDDELVDVVLLDIAAGNTVVVALVALGVAFEAPVPLVSLHPASRPEASSKEQTTHDPLAPNTRPS
jgi:hypothetical protein